MDLSGLPKGGLTSALQHSALDMIPVARKVVFLRTCRREMMGVDTWTVSPSQVSKIGGVDEAGKGFFLEREHPGSEGAVRVVRQLLMCYR